jgi:hypothetical protein
MSRRDHWTTMAAELIWWKTFCCLKIQVVWIVPYRLVMHINPDGLNFQQRHGDNFVSHSVTFPVFLKQYIKLQGYLRCSPNLKSCAFSSIKCKSDFIIQVMNTVFWTLFQGRCSEKVRFRILFYTQEATLLYFKLLIWYSILSSYKGQVMRNGPILRP